MRIHFSKNVPQELSQEFLEDKTFNKSLDNTVIAYYQHDTEGLRDRLLSDIADEMENNGMEPVRYSNQGLWVEDQGCYLKINVRQTSGGKVERFGKTYLPGFKRKRRYTEIYPDTEAAGSVTYEPLYNNDIIPMLRIVNNQGYEPSLELLADSLHELASGIENSKGEFTLNIYTGESG